MVLSRLYGWLLVLFIICGTCSPSLAHEKMQKYTNFEGQSYRWNTQMKKYLPYDTPYQKMMKKQLKNINMPSSDGKIKWWDFYGF